jgi:hypothetical protein
MSFRHLFCLKSFLKIINLRLIKEMASLRISHVTAPYFPPADFVTKTHQQVLKPAGFPENSQALDHKLPLG